MREGEPNACIFTMWPSFTLKPLERDYQTFEKKKNKVVIIAT